ncbi:hypothetical protein E2C01_073931 [Portunus trituberculatus]|uniref:Uncharacterized protein n=1 Tax=Portunus trituberculatus TaxID=210409 RepID=A0A5B7IB20_PORTR|nr:hypothetical protein [Portunus trituberculatus]
MTLMPRAKVESPAPALPTGPPNPGDPLTPFKSILPRHQRLPRRRPEGLALPAHPCEATAAKLPPTSAIGVDGAK